MYDQMLIGAANYLKKNSGDYIPFRIQMKGSDCTKIQKVLN